MSENRAEMVLEIIELENGELAIRSPESGSEPMIKVEFSDSLKGQLSDNYLDVARVMLTAGIQMAVENGVDLEPLDASDGDGETVILH